MKALSVLASEITETSASYVWVFSIWQGLNIVISGLSQQPEIICQRREMAEIQGGAYRTDNRRQYLSKFVQSFTFLLTPKEKKKYRVTSAIKVLLAWVSPNMSVLPTDENVFRDFSSSEVLNRILAFTLQQQLHRNQVILQETPNR